MESCFDQQDRKLDGLMEKTRYQDSVQHALSMMMLGSHVSPWKQT